MARKSMHHLLGKIMIGECSGWHSDRVQIHCKC